MRTSELADDGMGSHDRHLQNLTQEQVKAALRRSADVLNVAQVAGLTGSGWSHDLTVTCEMVTPGGGKRSGEALAIGYGLTDTPFGTALVAWAAQGVCRLDFLADGLGSALAALQQTWPGERLEPDDDAAQEFGNRIFGSAQQRGRLPVWLRGTRFQLKVWEALLRVPAGSIVSYTQLAHMAGVPTAQRAVGAAMGANAMAYLVPCHRVIRGDAVIGAYRWGRERKQAMLAWEATRLS